MIASERSKQVSRIFVAPLSNGYLHYPSERARESPCASILRKSYVQTRRLYVLSIAQLGGLTPLHRERAAPVDKKSGVQLRFLFSFSFFSFILKTRRPEYGRKTRRGRRTVVYLRRCFQLQREIAGKVSFCRQAEDYPWIGNAKLQTSSLARFQHSCQDRDRPLSHPRT